MAIGTPIAGEVKEAVLASIKNDGLSAAEAARKHGIHPHTVYNWFHRDTTVTTGSLQLEVNRLKKQNQELLALVGQLMLELKSFKKNQRF